MDGELSAQVSADNNNDRKNLVLLIYGLQALSFILGITFLVALILNYVKYDTVQGSWLESHFKWQIRTFWFAFLWSIIGIATMLFLVGYIILTLNALWVFYRILIGWLRLSDNKAMYL